MVRKETCTRCKGNRYVSKENASSQDKSSWAKCPACGGQGYKLRLDR